LNKNFTRFRVVDRHGNLAQFAKKAARAELDL
jgi:hypothetical protein